LEAGAPQLRVTDLAPATAELPVGAPGVVYGVAVTALDHDEIYPLLAEEYASTSNQYEVPLTSPEVTVVDVPEISLPTWLNGPLLLVASYT
jgi:hypothetical protein